MVGPELPRLCLDVGPYLQNEGELWEMPSQSKFLKLHC